jgi:LysR family transcriptional regulator, cyn operon transcriptional activator
VWLAAVASGLASCIWHSVEAAPLPGVTIVARGFDPPLHRELTALHRPDDVSPAAGHLLEVLGRFAELRT